MYCLLLVIDGALL